MIEVNDCSSFHSDNANAGYTDCEHPPTIANGKAELEVDDTGVNVMAMYSCKSGFQLQGESTIYCNTDSDEWQGEPPKCLSGEHLKCFRSIL